MSKPSGWAIMAQEMAKKIVAEQTRVRLMIGFDAAVIAAHETLQLGPGRAAAFANAYHDALDDLAELFVPYDRLYGGTYLDELGRVRALEKEENH